MSSDDPLFLDAEDVIEIHATQLEVYGGSAAIVTGGSSSPPSRNRRRRSVRRSHIVRNHPFIDGNKRAGLLAAVVFLDVNGISIAHPSDALYELTMGVAEGRVEKAAIAVELERIAKTRDGARARER